MTATAEVTGARPLVERIREANPKLEGTLIECFLSIGLLGLTLPRDLQQEFFGVMNDLLDALGVEGVEL